MPAGDLGVDDRSTGFEVCRRIKRDPRTARIPVIFVTALNDTTDRVKAIEAGGDDFLTKPHNRLVLGARVRSAAQAQGGHRRARGELRKQQRAREGARRSHEDDRARPQVAADVGHRRRWRCSSTATSAPLTEYAAARRSRDTESKAQELLRAHRGPARGRAASRRSSTRAEPRAARSGGVAQRGRARLGDPRCSRSAPAS